MEGVRQAQKTISRRGLLRGAGGLAGVALIGGAWDCTAIQTREQNLYLPKWDAEGFRVLQITDIHANSPSQYHRALEAAKMATRHKVDLIALTGDFLDEWNPTTIHQLTKFLDILTSTKCPIVAILGNHDCADLPVQEFVTFLSKFRLQLLRNRAIDLNGVSIAGVDDALFGFADHRYLERDEFSTSLLGLWHEPDAVIHMPSKVSLQLSGHSHGGEVCFPGGVPLHTPVMAKIYHGGFYARESVPLFVSKGVATTGPCRLYCPPEIAIHNIFSSKGMPARSEIV